MPTTKIFTNGIKNGTESERAELFSKAAKTQNYARGGTCMETCSLINFRNQREKEDGKSNPKWTFII
jgi:hypothetical protein